MKEQEGTESSQTDAKTGPEDSHDGKGSEALPYSRKERLQKLQNRLKESKSKNKQEVFTDTQRQKQRSLALKKAQKEKEREDLGGAPVSDQKDVSEREQLMKWTLEDWDRWNAKQGTKNRQHPENGDFNRLAELSYKKELRDALVDKVSYEKQKQETMIKHGLSHAQELRLVTDLGHKPHTEQKTALVEGIAEANRRRMKRKRADGADGSYINEKNRQFNEKLEREQEKRSKRDN